MKSSTLDPGAVIWFRDQKPSKQDPLSCANIWAVIAKLQCGNVKVEQECVCDLRESKQLVLFINPS